MVIVFLCISLYDLVSWWFLFQIQSEGKETQTMKTGSRAMSKQSKQAADDVVYLSPDGLV